MDVQKTGAFFALFLCILVTVPSATEGRARLYQWVAKYELTPPVGYRKLSVTVNGHTPGPTIPAYRGDMLIINVTNKLGKEDLAIQFDRVRPIGKGWTEPIRPGTTFSYRFFVDRVGDYPYHARSRLQEMAGLRGLIRVLPAYVGNKGVPTEEGAHQAGKLAGHAKGSGKTKGSKRP